MLFVRVVIECGEHTHTHYRTKCCYGLTMDLLDNIATELSFEFHLYVVRDQLFGSKQQRDVKDFIKSNTKMTTQHSSNMNSNSNNNSGTNGNGSPSASASTQQPTDHDGNDETPNSKYKDKHKPQVTYHDYSQIYTEHHPKWFTDIVLTNAWKSTKQIAICYGNYVRRFPKCLNSLNLQSAHWNSVDEQNRCCTHVTRHCLPSFSCGKHADGSQCMDSKFAWNVCAMLFNVPSHINGNERERLETRNKIWLSMSHTSSPHRITSINKSVFNVRHRQTS